MPLLRKALSSRLFLTTTLPPTVMAFGLLAGLTSGHGEDTEA